MSQKAHDLLEQLCKDADPRKDKSLRLIYSICEEQKKRGSRDYSVATIGRLSLEAEGPSAASIRNKTGECYRALIKAYAIGSGGKTRKSAEPHLTDTNLILEGVVDPVLRTRLGLLLAELEATRAQLSAARHLASQNSIVNLANYPQIANNEVCSNADIDALPPVPMFTDMEVRALKMAISEKTFEHWGWHADGVGRVLNETDQQVFGAGFVTGIQKVLNSIE